MNNVRNSNKPMATKQLHYHVSLPNPFNQTFEVELTISSPDSNGQVLTLPAWIPGSYMIRDFARNIVSLTARDASGAAVEVSMLDKQTWQLAPCDGSVTVSYQVYAYDLSIRSAYVCDQYAFFNGTSVFLKPVGLEHLPCQLSFVKPDAPHCSDWQVSTSLPCANGTPLHNFGDYDSENYDDLIDHPVLFGNIDVYPFEAEDVSFELVLAGGHQADTDRMVADLEKICAHHINLFGKPAPVSRYIFMTLLCADGFGGLEHTHSTALLFSRDDLPQPHIDKMTEGYRTFLSLCSHEFFHTWHVKRIKPLELAQADLAAETYTEQLWIYEGFTSFYDDMSLIRSNVVEPQDYLEMLGQQLTRLHRNTGRFKQTVTNSSFLAWTRFYKQDASAINTIVSYYNKGAVIAMCLDILIRQQSNGTKSLDDVMRYLWQHFGQTNTGTPFNVVHTILTDVLNIDATTFLNKALYTTEELDVASLLAHVGIAYHTRARNGLNDKGGLASETTVRHWLGAMLKSHGDGAQVTQISDDSPAQQAGIQLNDKIIALNGWQINAENAQARLDACQSGEEVDVHVLRDKRLVTLKLPVIEAPQDTVYLTIDESNKAEPWLGRTQA